MAGEIGCGQNQKAGGDNYCIEKNRFSAGLQGYGNDISEIGVFSGLVSEFKHEMYRVVDADAHRHRKCDGVAKTYRNIQHPQKPEIQQHRHCDWDYVIKSSCE